MERTELDLGDLRAFFVVVETGSFTRAAHRLDSAKSVVSRRVARLEDAVAAQLLQRTPDGAFLTEAGQLYYDQALSAFTDLECAAEHLNDHVQEIAGNIRLTIPVYFGANYLAPLLCEFLSLYPAVDLEVNSCDDKLDIVRMGYDIAIRAGHLRDSSLSYRALTQSRRRLVASPAYLDATPRIERPEDLTAHRILHYNSLSTPELWRYLIDGKPHFITVSPCLRTNSATLLMAGVSAGQGLTLLPGYIVDPFIERGQAVNVLPDIDWDITPMSLLLPAGRRAPQRVRKLQEFLLSKFNGRVL